MARALDPMLITIAHESRTLAEYARRADAWASSERHAPTVNELVDAWITSCKRKQNLKRVPNGLRTQTLAALATAATERITKCEQLWGYLADNINTNEED